MEVVILVYLLIASQCLLGNPCISKYRVFVQGYFLVYDYLQKKELYLFLLLISGFKNVMPCYFCKAEMELDNVIYLILIVQSLSYFMHFQVQKK